MHPSLWQSLLINNLHRSCFASRLTNLKNPFSCFYDSIKVGLVLREPITEIFFSNHGWNYSRDSFQLVSVEKFEPLIFWNIRKKKTFQKLCVASRPRVSIIKCLALAVSLWSTNTGKENCHDGHEAFVRHFFFFHLAHSLERKFGKRPWYLMRSDWHIIVS